MEGIQFILALIVLAAGVVAVATWLFDRIERQRFEAAISETDREIARTIRAENAVLPASRRAGQLTTR